MAKPKKYPKKPKQSASVKVMENYLSKVKMIDKYNADLKKEAAKREMLKKKIQNLK
jgi:hypothetical protein